MEKPAPHFGTVAEMLAWCERENITPTKDEEGRWDWFAALAIYEARLAETETDDQPES